MTAKSNFYNVKDFISIKDNKDNDCKNWELFKLDIKYILAYRYMHKCKKGYTSKEYITNEVLNRELERLIHKDMPSYLEEAIFNIEKRFEIETEKLINTH